VTTTKQKEERRRKPKPEEQEGVPQNQHYPAAKGNVYNMEYLVLFGFSLPPSG
jgi:hypothetical protein